MKKVPVFSFTYLINLYVFPSYLRRWKIGDWDTIKTSKLNITKHSNNNIFKYTNIFIALFEKIFVCYIFGNKKEIN